MSKRGRVPLWKKSSPDPSAITYNLTFPPPASINVPAPSAALYFFLSLGSRAGPDPIPVDKAKWPLINPENVIYGRSRGAFIATGNGRPGPSDIGRESERLFHSAVSGRRDSSADVLTPPNCFRT